ncbi:MAG: hypothetical protein IJJ96_09145 [Bacteroidales bacterium]|nr:hypothetical protein [Bacteroidales bacterium]
MIFCVIAICVIVVVLFLFYRDRIHMVECQKDAGTKLDSLERTVDRLLVRMNKADETLRVLNTENQKIASQVKEKNKQVTLESVRLAVRYNGFSPEIIGTHAKEWTIVSFKVEDTIIRIDTSRLPYLVFQLVYSLKLEDYDTELLSLAASEVTSRMIIGKVVLSLENKLLSFDAEMLCHSYHQLRDDFKGYLNILFETQSHFTETYERLKEEKEKAEKALDNDESIAEIAQSFKSPSSGKLS